MKQEKRETNWANVVCVCVCVCIEREREREVQGSGVHSGRVKILV